MGILASSIVNQLAMMTESLAMAIARQRLSLRRFASSSFLPDYDPKPQVMSNKHQIALLRMFTIAHKGEVH